MPGSLSKYWKDRSDAQGKELFWPGTIDGYPVRGEIPGAMRQEEFENIPLVYDAQAKYFNLPDEMEEYLQVIDRAANGWYQLRHERVVQPYDPETQTEVVFLQWLEIHGEVPDAKSSFTKPQKGPRRAD